MTPIKHRSSWLLCAAVLLLLTGSASAQDDPDGQVWVQFLALGTLGEDWRSHIEIQPRFQSNSSELGLTLIRGAIGHTLGRRTTVWGGYGWIPRTLGAGLRNEQRTWQQVLVTPAVVAGWTSSLRFRLEQRWLTPWEDNAHRFRFLGRGQHPLDRSRQWSLYAYDEVMLTLDRTVRGPSPGFDRNRLSSGLSRRLAPGLSTDVGYLWEHAVAADGSRNDHVFIAVINLSAPR